MVDAIILGVINYKFKSCLPQNKEKNEKTLLTRFELILNH